MSFRPKLELNDLVELLFTKLNLTMELIALKMKLHVIDKIIMDLKLFNHILECLFLPQHKYLNMSHEACYIRY